MAAETEQTPFHSEGMRPHCRAGGRCGYRQTEQRHSCGAHAQSGALTQLLPAQSCPRPAWLPHGAFQAALLLLCPCEPQASWFRRASCLHHLLSPLLSPLNENRPKSKDGEKEAETVETELTDQSEKGRRQQTGRRKLDR